VKGAENGAWSDHDSNAHIADRCGGCGDDKVEDVTGVVGRLGNVLNAAERLQQIKTGKAHGVNVVPLIDVDVKVAAYDDWTSVDRQQL